MPSSSPSSTTPSSFFRIALFLGAALWATEAGRAAEPTSLLFTEVAEEAGILFQHNYGADRLHNVLMTTGSGCALFDIDNDGWLDAFFVNGTFQDPSGRVARDRATRHALYRNKGDGTFDNITRRSGIVEPTYGQGCATGDFDGDGFVDLYITNYGRNKLYRNKGDGSFEDVTAASGTGDERWGAGAAFFDHDGDGDLDLYVSNYLVFRPDMVNVHSSSLSKRTGFLSFPGPRDYEAEDDILYRNDGRGTFTDVTATAGLVPGGKGLTVVTLDFDDDGDPDIFVANDASPNFLYRNDGGRFTEIGLQAGVAYDPDGVETAAMGVDVADVDGDGKTDLYVTNMVFEFNNLYLNGGKLAFKDETRSFGLDDDNYRHVGWATRFADFDHDGQLECFVANGHVVDYVDGFSQSITYAQHSMFFRKKDGTRYRNDAASCGDVFKKKRVSRGGAFGDIDNDGDIDILLSNSGARAELLRNDLPANDRWIKVRLRGRSPNTQALGAKVRLQIGGRSELQEVRTSGSYLSANDPTLHFGLGPEESEGTVEIVWPGGARTRAEVVKGQLNIIEESLAPPRPQDAAQDPR